MVGLLAVSVLAACKNDEGDLAIDSTTSFAVDILLYERVYSTGYCTVLYGTVLVVTITVCSMISV